MATVVLAMSGGVDSSVAAHLLKKQGHQVVGIFMRHGEQPVETACATSGSSLDAEERGTVPFSSQASGKSGQSPVGATSLPVVSRLAHKQGCCTASDAEDARRVALSMDIPFYAIDFQEEFSQIIDYFIDEYQHARTPNPCVVCNNWIKFGRLFDYADSVGAEFVATGHYARLLLASDPQALPRLARGVDTTKDQSYVLFGIERELLRRMLLPVGEFRKEEIRRMAAGLGLSVADKRDSQEICFVPEGDHAAFIRAKRGESASAGEIVTSAGEVVGHHDGLERFTIGQRKGVGVALGEPRYVVRLEQDTHRVVLGTKEELGRASLWADRVNWLVPPSCWPAKCLVQIRYNARAVLATVTRHDERLQIEFDTPQHGVSPGQAVVCYDGDQVLGGGWIE